ncbi:hypothetical protein ABN356_02775 [Providencia rettgeri]|uniref:hypothetical protein n=1 Tax=Providencia rettgeri TaxID=587 RepID=UPI0023AA5CE1|nr:hypothetical protein [Providencia rettgeri]
MKIPTVTLSGEQLLEATAKALGISIEMLKSDLSYSIILAIETNGIMIACDGENWWAFNKTNEFNPLIGKSDYIDCYRTDADAEGKTIGEAVFRAICVEAFGEIYEVNPLENSLKHCDNHQYYQWGRWKDA